METIDVAPAISVGTEDDPTASERPAALVGVLPSGVPDDLPLYIPASLIDFGIGDGGSRYVSLLTPHSQAQVERELVAQVRESGWAVAGTGDGASLLSKGGVQVRLRIEDAKPGTLYHFEY